MAVQGHYNHYDDPDEFWDDEPIVRRPNPSVPIAQPAVITSPPAAQPLVSQDLSSDRASGAERCGSSMVSMELDGGFLPAHIHLNPAWSRYVAPYEVGDELMAGYRGAVVERLRKVYSGSRWPSPQEVSNTAVPDHRTRLMVLLETQSWEQYQDAASGMINGVRHQVGGRVEIDGQHAVVLNADRQYIKSISVRSDWVASAHTDQLVGEILYCSDVIRSLRPKFIVKMDFSRYSDEDLEYHLRGHRQRLLNERLR